LFYANLGEDIPAIKDFAFLFQLFRELVDGSDQSESAKARACDLPLFPAYIFRPYDLEWLVELGLLFQPAQDIILFGRANLCEAGIVPGVQDPEYFLSIFFDRGNGCLIFDLDDKVHIAYPCPELPARCTSEKQDEVDIFLKFRSELFCEV